MENPLHHVTEATVYGPGVPTIRDALERNHG